MNYIAPDYELVTIKAQDAFANNAYQTGCPHDESTTYTVPCTPSDPNYYHEDFLELGWGDGCYSVYNP